MQKQCKNERDVTIVFRLLNFYFFVKNNNKKIIKSKFNIKKSLEIFKVIKNFLKTRSD